MTVFGIIPGRWRSGPGGHGASVETHQRMRQLVRPRIQRALAKWPSLAPSDLDEDVEGFARYLLRMVKGRSGDEGGPGEGLHFEDLYLAYACQKDETLRECRAAKAALEGLLAKAADRVASRHKAGAAFRDELLQQLRIRLLLPQKSGEPRLAGYEGLGPLAGWVAATAQNVARTLVQDQRRGPELDPGDAFLEIPAEDVDVERDVMEKSAQATVQASLAVAVSKLPAAKRDVLRLNIKNGLKVEVIAEQLGKDRATIFRYIAGAREFIRSETEKVLLRQRSRDEAKELIALAVSTLELSLKEIL